MEECFMFHAAKRTKISFDVRQQYQKVDGFGVNINCKYWDNGKLTPVMDLLVDDLGARLFRVDAYGKSNWVDPESQLDSSVLNQNTYEKVYAGREFQYAVEMCRYLNDKGIEPFVTMSGMPPLWMCTEDGKTLADYHSFAELAVSYLRWLKYDRKIKFTLFSPFNETDLGPPEGPFVSPVEYAKVLEILIDKMDRNGLEDIRFVSADQAYFSLEYVKALQEKPLCMQRVGVLGMHCYTDIHHHALPALIEGTPAQACRLWMTEYGDLDQTGDREWYVAWKSFERLLRLLQDGFHGALIWDAFDNYHDHNEAWTIYGILRTGLGAFTPKKRYYAIRHAYRFVKPGFTRIKTETSEETVDAAGFLSPDSSEIALIGMNHAPEPQLLVVRLDGVDSSFDGRRITLYITDQTLNCANAVFSTVRRTFEGEYEITVEVPAKSIFTVTTMRNMQ